MSSSVWMVRNANTDSASKVNVAGAMPEITSPSWVTRTLTVSGTFPVSASGLESKQEMRKLW